MQALQVNKRIVFICSVLFTTFFSFAQKNVDHQDQFWVRYSLSLKFNEHWSATQDIEERTYWFPWRQHQFVLRSMARYKFDNGFGVGGGFAYFLQTLPQDPNQPIDYTQPELRPEFELSYNQKISDKISINHRYWTELRYFKLPEEDYTFGNYRFRYKLELQYKPSKTITLRAFDEIFINAGKNITDNTFDQNRYGVSIQYMPIKNFGLELGYINWFQQRPSGIDFYNRDIVRLTIHQTIDLNTSKK